MNDEGKSLKRDGVESLKKLRIANAETDMERISLISKKLGYNLPIDYCTYYSNHATSLHIKPNLFKVNNKEKMISYLFSIDKDSRTYIMNFQKFDSKYEQNLVPFAELEFGDLLCFDRKDDSIVHYNHEIDTITRVSKSWTDFEKALYE